MDGGKAASSEGDLIPTQLMDPKDIGFTQSLISPVFSKRVPSGCSSYSAAVRHHDGGGTLEGMLEQLRSGRLAVEDVPPIRVVLWDGRYLSLDNRRLWVFKEFGRPIPVQVLPLGDCSKEFFQKLDPQRSVTGVSITSKSERYEKYHPTTMVQHVLSWSLHNVQHTKMYENKAKPMGLTFESLDQYLKAFKWAVLEETRAVIEQQLEDIEAAPRFKVSARQLSGLRGMSKFKTFELEVPEGNYEPRAKDLVLLSTVWPESLHDLNRATYMFGFLRQEFAEGRKDELRFKTLVHAPEGSPEYAALHDDKATWTVIHITNIGSMLRIWDALVSLYENPGQRAGPVLEEVIRAELNCTVPGCQPTPFDEAELLVRTYCQHFRSLNQSQVEAVVHAVSGVVNRVAPRVRLIQGPPGTGKTSMLVSVLSILGSMRYRVHMSAPTNAAIGEVASRFISQMLVPEQKHEQFGACFPHVLARGGEGCRVLNSGDVVLVGNEERLDLETHDVLETIYLPRRVIRLLEALSSTTGYRKCAEALKNFLKCALSEFERYTQCISDNGEEPLSLVNFVRKNLKVLSSSVIRQSHTLCQDVPTFFLTSEARESLYQASLLTEEVVAHFNARDFSDEEIRTLLCRTPVEPSPLTGVGDIKLLNFENFVKVKDDLLQVLGSCAVDGCGMVGGCVPTASRLKRLCIQNCKILFSTVSTGGKDAVQSSGTFDCVVIDEASQLVEAETLVVTKSPKLQQVLLVGDHKQLAPTVLSQLAKKWRYDRSMFARLQNLKRPCQMLNMQYRMHPDISSFPNEIFYAGDVRNGPNVLSEAYSTKPFQNLFMKTYSFLDVSDGTEEKECGQRSYTNSVEVAIVMHLIAKLNQVCEAEDISLSIGIIAPYRGQVEMLARRVEGDDRLFSNLIAEVRSVDGFQGREKDVIIFSAVRSNPSGSIGFLSAPERLNVAITRARYCLWMVGNAQTLSSDELWSSLIKDCKQRNCLLKPDHGMVKVIRRAMSKLNRLEDLLNPNSCLFNNTPWQVFSSFEISRTLSNLKSKHTRQCLLGAILNLAEGRHEIKWTYRREFSGPHARIAQVRPVGALFLVWSVELKIGSEVKQILKVWDAVVWGQVPSLLDRLDNAFFTYTEEYVKMCTQRETPRKGIVLPMKWAHDPQFVQFKASKRQNPVSRNSSEFVAETEMEKASVDDSILVMKFYAMNSRVAHRLITAADGSCCELPFEVNDDEDRIVQLKGSSFILGRSGTGKTTVLTRKIMERDQRFQLANNGVDHQAHAHQVASRSKVETLRQALLTRSPKLCAAIRLHINKTQRMLEAVHSAGSTESLKESTESSPKLHDDDEESMLGSVPDSFRGIPSDRYPLVITFRKLLNMIEGSVATPFFTPEERAWRVCSASNMVAAALLNAGNAGDSVFKDEEAPPSRMKTFRVEVDFTRFCSVYWKRFNSELTKGFDASLVFTEFMSAIKGSLAALRSPRRYMERSDYVALADKKTSMFGEQDRDMIYKLFAQYEKLKRYYNDYDLADFVMHLHAELEHGELQGQKLHYVYVDEVQDLTQAQIALLKYVCPNLQDGFMFAGDTAQTTAKGVGFRFEDVRNLYYAEFLQKNRDAEDAVLAESSGRKPAALKNKSLAVPDMFFLTQNFRTHSGILKLANNVVQHLYHFFPYAIDKLQPETSLLQGDSPLFLQTDEDVDLIAALFERGEVGGGGCEFGAEQAIVVRHEHRKKAILRSLEDKNATCLVLTVEECKGLEFQDVLLYNFFADSGLDRTWRVVYDMQKEMDLDSGEKLHTSCSKFQPHKHNVLCSELKQLYVAITRARQRLFLYDGDANAHRPLLDCWRSTDLVQVQKLDDSVREQLKRKSTADEWQTTGIKMLEAQNFLEAKMCFQKSGNSEYALFAEAENLVRAASRPGQKPQAVKQHLQAARDIYRSIEKIDRAVICCKYLGDHKTGGDILEQKHRYEEAGDFYVRGKHWPDAANVYQKGECFLKCLETCWQGKLFDLSLSYIDEWKQLTDAKTLQGSGSCPEPHVLAYLEKCAAHFQEQKKVQELMKYVKRFPTILLQRIFLREKHPQELLALEEAAGNFREAEAIAEQIGAWEHSATLSQKAGDVQKAIDKLLRLAQLEWFWGGGNGKGLPLLTRVEQLLETQPQISQASRLELAIMNAWRNTSADVGVLLDTWNEVRGLQFRRLEILAGKNMLWYLLNVKIGDPGCIIAKVRNDWNVQTGGQYEALVEDAAIVVLCKKLWVLWSDCARNVLRSLNGFALGEISTDDPFLKACFELLGVQQVGAGEGFKLQYREASWLQGQCRSGQLTKKILTSMALEYWREDIFLLIERIMDRMARSYHLMRQMGGDIELQLELATEMVALGSIRDTVTLGFQNRSSRRDPLFFERAVYDILREYAGHRPPRNESVVAVLDSLAKTAKVAELHILLPFISRQCFLEILEVKQGVVLDVLKAWSLFGTVDEAPSVCDQLISQIPLLAEFHASFRRAGHGEDAMLCWFERHVVALSSLQTRLRGLVIPARLAFSCMSGSNQEPFYCAAARAGRGHDHTALSNYVGEIVDSLLGLLETGRHGFRVMAALIVLVLNMPRPGGRLQHLLKLIRRKHHVWKLHVPVQRALSQGLYEDDSTRKLLGKAFVRAMAADGNPVIVLTPCNTVFPQWVTEIDDITPVFLQDDGSGNLRFSLNGTTLDKGQSEHVWLLHDLSRGLEDGKLDSVAEVLSRKAPPPATPAAEEEPLCAEDEAADVSESHITEKKETNDEASECIQQGQSGRGKGP